MISNNDENSYSKTYKKTVQKMKSFNFWFFVNTLSKLQIDQYPLQGSENIFQAKKLILSVIEIFRVLNLENFSKISQN